MIRSTKVTLKYSNKIKLNTIDSILDEYLKVTQFFVDLIWNTYPINQNVPTLLPQNITNQAITWFSARLIQCAAKQASGIVRGTRRKHEKRLFVLEQLRKDGFFTLTAYYVNQFLDKDAKKLDESVLLTESKRIPQHLKGARGCIYVDGGPHRNDIAMCLGSKAKAQNILNVLNDFERCRLGDNLQPIPKAVLRKLIRTCMKGKGKAGKGKGGKGASKIKKGKGRKKLAIKKESQNPWRDNRKKFFHPLKLQVPGTRR